MELPMDGPERRLLRDLLKYSDQRCRKLVELAEEGVWVFNRDEVTIFANSEMARMLGYSPEEMLGMPAQQFLAEAEPDSKAEIWSACCAPAASSRTKSDFATGMDPRSGSMCALPDLRRRMENLPAGLVFSATPRRASGPRERCGRVSGAITICLPMLLSEFTGPPATV